MSTRQSPPAAGHDWAAKLLSALLDGELDETTAAAVTAHAHRCAVCNCDWAALRATKQLLAALPAVQAPRTYAVLADNLGEPGRTWATFWQRLLGLTWRLSGALAVVVILIGTMQITGIRLGGESAIHYIQAPPGELGPTGLPAAQRAAAPAGPQGERAATGAPEASGAAGQAISVQQEQVIEQVMEKRVAKREVAERAVAAEPDVARAPRTAAARAPTPAASPTAAAQPTATPARPTAVPTPARAALTAAPQREPDGPTVPPGVPWLIGGAAVVVLAGMAWLGERWVRRRQV